MIEERPEFPKTFDHCPNCGSTRRVANEILQAEKEKGKILDGNVTAFMSKDSTIIADPRKQWLSAVAVTALYDVCMECGTLYAFRVETQVVVPQFAKSQKPNTRHN